jgi:hypothetical protein
VYVFPSALRSVFREREREREREWVRVRVRVRGCETERERDRFLGDSITSTDILNAPLAFRAGIISHESP